MFKIMVDIHYELRSSERGVSISYEKLVINGRLVEKRRKFFKGKWQKCYYYEGFVHIYGIDKSTYQPKRITVVPYSKRKWKFVVK